MLADDGERGKATLSRVSSPVVGVTAPQPRPRQKPWTPANAWPAAINQPAASASPPLPPKMATGAHDELRPSHAKISAWKPTSGAPESESSIQPSPEASTKAARGESGIGVGAPRDEGVNCEV